MKTKNLFAVVIITVFFTASYALNAQTAKSDTGNVSADSFMNNHNQSVSQMTGSGDMMAMMKQCKSMMQMMQDMNNQINNKQCCSVNGHVSNKNDNSFIYPSTKNGSYGHFQYQREKNKKVDRDK